MALPARWTAVAGGCLVAGALALLALLAAGHWLTRPAPRAVGPPPAGFEAISIAPPDGGRIAGWLAPGRAGAGAVLLLHALRSDRRQMLGRAAFLQHAGYAVLAIDLPAHGESPGARIAYGRREAAGVEAALAELRRRLPGERVAAIGVSLGAASLLGCAPRCRVDAAVLESMFPTLAEAAAARLALHIGTPAAALAPLLLWPLPWFLGDGADGFRPIDALPRLGAPVLVAAGDADRHTPAEQTARLFGAAGAPKELWLIPGAAHVDLHAYDRAAYEARILDFLDRRLRRDATAPAS